MLEIHTKFNYLSNYFTSASWKRSFSNIQKTPRMAWYICKPKQCANIVERGMVDCLSFQILPYLVQCRFVCPSAYLSVWLGVCLQSRPSLCLSSLLHPDGPGTLPALCHMISLKAAGVKLIWSGLKAYKRLMLHINRSHLNSPFPSLKCPSCPCSAPNLQIFTNGKCERKLSVVPAPIGYLQWHEIIVR